MSETPTAVVGWYYGRVSPASGEWDEIDEVIDAAWKEADMAVITQHDVHADSPPPDVHGVPMDVLRARIGQGRGGAGDIQERFLEVVVNLWPLASSGYVGAMSADAWGYTKRGLKVALRRLFERGATKVTINVADDARSDDYHDDSYIFEHDDASDIERAVEQLATGAAASGGIEIRTTTTHSTWDKEAGTWMPQEEIVTLKRITPLTS
jgi:hypothetical protein